MAKLVIDNREHKLIELFQPKVLCPFQIAQLDIGDVVIEFDNSHECNITFERKTIADLEASVHDGRYREQKARAKANRVRLMYIVEGDFYFSDSNPSQKTLSGCIINTIIRDKIGVFFTKNVKETANLIECIYNRVTNDPGKYKELPMSGSNGSNCNNGSNSNNDYVATITLRKKDNIDVPTCFMLQLACIPGISAKKAKAIMDYHQDIHCMKDLCEKIKHVKAGDFFKKTPGIGKLLAETIHQFCVGQ